MPKKDITKDIPQTVGVEPKKEVQEVLKEIGPKKLSIIILFVLAVLGMYGTGHFYNKYKAVTKNPNLEAQRETESLVAAVGKLMELPNDETPSIATISDKEKLNNQPFFKTGENGDKLFTYTKAMKAILYRPQTNKIINVAPIAVNQGATVAPETRQSTSTPVAKKKLH